MNHNFIENIVLYYALFTKLWPYCTNAHICELPWSLYFTAEGNEKEMCKWKYMTQTNQSCFGL